MDKVEELKVELKEAMESFRQKQQKKRIFLFNSHMNFRHILMRNLSESFNESLEDYFDQRNESLQSSLMNLDDYLNKASEAIATMASFRANMVQASNQAIEPPIHAEDSPISVNGKGMGDLRKISTQTEESVLLINSMQVKYSDLMADIEQKIPIKLDAILSETREKNENAELENEREMKEVFRECEEELEKAVQVLQSTEKMREELERLLVILNRPKTP